MDIGSAKLGMTVAETLRRNKKITRMTSTMVPIRVNWTSCTDSRIDSVRSKKKSSLTDCGICVRKPGRISLTEFTTSTTLAPGCL